MPSQRLTDSRLFLLVLLTYALTTTTAQQPVNLPRPHMKLVLPLPAAQQRHHPGKQPSFATPNVGLADAVYPGSYGIGQLEYHGGNVMHLPKYQAVFWNANVANSPGSLGNPNLRQQIDKFASTFMRADSADYNVISQYTDTTCNLATETCAASSNSHDWTPAAIHPQAYVSTRRKKRSLGDGTITDFIQSLFNSGALVPDPSTMYGVYLESGMTVQLDAFTASCRSFCAYHWYFNYAYQGKSMQIKYAVYPYLNCPACKFTNLQPADMMTIVTSHEIREIATNPADTPNYSWYDASGYEADDKCSWHHLYQLSRSDSSKRMWVQPEWSNAQNGCVVPGLCVGSGCL